MKMLIQFPFYVTHFPEAIQQDFFDIAILLIDSGCNVCQTDRLQQAPIHSAVRKGKLAYPIDSILNKKGIGDN